MNWKATKTLGGGRAVAVLGLAGALLMTSGSTGIAQSSNSASTSGLAGSWVVQVTLRDCVTNAPLGPPFKSLGTYHRGGTLSDSAGSLTFAAGQRTDGHGTWTHQHGDTYLQRIIALILFDTAPNLPGSPGFNPSLPVSPGFFAGWYTITHTIEATDADHLTSAGTSEFYKSDGTLYRTGCSTGVFQRFE